MIKIYRLVIVIIIKYVKCAYQLQLIKPIQYISPLGFRVFPHTHIIFWVITLYFLVQILCAQIIVYREDAVGQRDGIRKPTHQDRGIVFT